MRQLLVCLLLGTVSCSPHQVKNPPPAETRDNPTDVGFCELISAPERFDGAEIRVRAVYRYGFERSDLYSPSCPPEKQTWMRGRAAWVEGAFKYCGGSERVEWTSGDHDNPWRGRTVGLTAVGQFRGGGNHGHMSAYTFKLDVRCVEEAEALLDVGDMLHDLSDEQQRRLGAWESSK